MSPPPSTLFATPTPTNNPPPSSRSLFATPTPPKNPPPSSPLSISPSPTPTNAPPPLPQAHHHWQLDPHQHIFRPDPDQTSRLLHFLATRHTHDHAVRFISSFPAPSVTSPPLHHLYIHQSRLEWAGGALSRLATSVDADVVVGDHKDFALFFHIRRFLYGLQVDFDLSVVDLMRLVKLAYRWEVWELVRGVTEYVRVVDLLAQSEEESWVVGVVSAAEVVRLPAVDERFVEYFWACVGREFDKFVKVMGRRRWREEEGWTGFPRMWEMALEQGMVARVFEEAVGRVGRDSLREFLDVVLVELEPKIESDAEVSRLLQVLGRRVVGYGKRVLKEGALDRDCSVRAIRLLAKAVLGKKRRWWGLRRLLNVPVQLLMWRGILEGVKRIEQRRAEGRDDDSIEEGGNEDRKGFRWFGRA